MDRQLNRDKESGRGRLRTRWFTHLHGSSKFPDHKVVKCCQMLEVQLFIVVVTAETASFFCFCYIFSCVPWPCFDEFTEPGVSCWFG